MVALGVRLSPDVRGKCSSRRKVLETIHLAKSIWKHSRVEMRLWLQMPPIRQRRQGRADLIGRQLGKSMLPDSLFGARHTLLLRPVLR